MFVQILTVVEVTALVTINIDLFSSSSVDITKHNFLFVVCVCVVFIVFIVSILFVVYLRLSINNVLIRYSTM